MRKFVVRYKQNRIGFARGKSFDGGSWEMSEEVAARTRESAISKVKKIREHRTSLNKFWIEILDVREV